jgi:transcriptional regulator with GAF, ATPase, and Fis domain
VLIEVERRKLQQALDDNDWDMARAAADLEIPPRMLLAKIKEHALEQKKGPLLS